MIWFIFLCFLFGKGLTKDACSKPEEVPEAYIERVKDRNKTNFTHNTKLLYACNPGRRMSGESAERKCDNGKWTDVKFECEMGSCRYIATPQNGRRLEQNYWPGQMTVFECNHGYRMVGNSRLMCMTNWEWDPEEPPKCETVICPSRGSNLRNGDVKATFFNGVRNGYNTVIRYSCKDGYKFESEGMQTQRCLGTGRWEGEEPKCVRRSCPDLGVLKNGRIDYDMPDRRFFSWVYYECNAKTDLFLESELAGNNARECQTNEQWEGSNELHCYKRSTGKPNSNCKLCEDRRCKTPVKEEGKEFKHGSEIYSRPMSKYEMFRDGDGYLEEDVIKHKQNDGQWEKPFPLCIEARCEIKNKRYVLTSYINGSTTGLKVPSSYVVIFACKSAKYELQGSSNGTCNKGVLNVPSCKPKKCPNKDLPTIANLDLSQLIDRNARSNHESTTSLCCYDKHELWDNATNKYKDATDVKVTCDFGKWIPKRDSLACVPKRCNVSDVLKPSESQVWTMSGDGLYQSLNDKKVKHELKVYMNCTNRYELLETNEDTTLSMVSGTCNKGTLRMPLTCTPKRCWLKVLDNSKYWFIEGDSIVSITEARYFDHGMNISTYCNNGYILTNTHGKTSDTSQTARCYFGVWQNAYLCTAKKCPKPKFHRGKMQTKNKTVVNEDVPHSTKVTFECKYKLRYDLFTKDNKNVSSLEATCRLGNWSEPIPKCHRKKCLNKDLPNIPNSLATKEDLSQLNYNDTSKHNAKIFLSCDDKHRLWDNNKKRYKDDNNVKVTCYYGNWKSKSASHKCVPKRCNLTVHVNSKYWYTNGTRVVPTTKKISIEHGMNISSECNDGYILNTEGQTSDTNQTVQCYFGDWQNAYLCTEKSCEIPDVDNGRMLDLTDNQQYVKHNEQVTLKCDALHEIFNNDGQAGDELITTCDKGNWNVKEIVCKPKKCTLPLFNNGTMKTENGTTVTEAVTDDTKITFECNNKRYDLLTWDNKPVSRFEATCKLGNWSEPIPKCHPRECKLAFVNGTVTVNNEKRTTGVLYEDETAKVKCTSDLEMIDSSGNIFNDNNFITTCRNKTLTKPLPFCKDRKCFFTESSNWQALRAENITIIEEKFVQHGKKVHVQCNDGFEYKTDNANITTVYVCTDTRWKPTLPVCERKTINTDSQESSNTSHPKGNGGYTKTTTVISSTLFTFLSTKSTPAATEETPTVEECMIDDQNRYTFYNTSTLDRMELKNGSMVELDTKVYVQCQSEDDYSVYDVIEEEFHVICTKNTRTLVPVGLECTQVVECQYKVANGTLIKAPGSGYKLTCDKGYRSNLHDSDTVSCKDGKLKSENDLDPACNLGSDKCFIPNDLKGIEVKRDQSILTGRVEVNHTDTVTINCGNGKEPQGREFKCDDGSFQAQDDEKDWEFDNKGFFPQCRIAKCETNCSNHGTCVKDNVCECSVGYSDRFCSKVNCSDICLTSGGRCHKPNNCTCPGTRAGKTCALRSYLCSIPIDMNGITVKKDMSVLRGGLTINHAETATFNCQNGYEPDNREFKCDNGAWIAQDDDKDWTFENNGSFPQCRMTYCNNNCNNNGICVKDGVCKCDEIHKGKECEHAVCQPACISNGGMCNKQQSKCICPAETKRYGLDCQSKYCNPPITNARITNWRTFFGPYDDPQLKCDDNLVLSSTEKLECKNGTWSLDVNCVEPKKTKYTLLVCTDRDSYAGTTSSVDINIIGRKGSTGELRLADRFKTNTLYPKTLNGFDVGNITKIRLSLIGYNQWKPKWIAIYDKETGYCAIHLGDYFANSITVDIPTGSCYNFEKPKGIYYAPRYWKVNQVFPKLNKIQCKLFCAQRDGCFAVYHRASSNDCYFTSYEPYYNLFNTINTRESFVHFYKKT